MRRALLAGLVLLAGCGRDDSEWARLDPRDIVEFYAPPEEIAKADGIMRTHANTNLGWIPYGTRARVLSDPDPSGQSMRDVSILLIEGEHKDASILLERKRLRRVN